MHLEVNNDLELPFPEEIEGLIRSLPLGQSKGIRSFSTTRMLQMSANPKMLTKKKMPSKRITNAIEEFLHKNPSH